ncbi:hypothetical protein [Thalassospira australica]|uniref:hypothetical protein n=1 Tax=Thalassospira australica TaxID=1528106 RepID=UPI00384ECF76
MAVKRMPSRAIHWIATGPAISQPPSRQAHLSRSAFSFRQILRRPFPGHFNAQTHSCRIDFAPHGSSALGGNHLLFNHSTSSLFHHVIPLALTDNPPPGNAKTRRSASRLAGYVSGPIYPVDFVFMPQTKEQIKNILQKFSLSGPGKNSRLFSINYAIILPYEGPVR